MTDGDLELAELFAAFARALLAEKDMQALLDRVCTAAVATIDGCDHAGVTLLSKKAIATHGASDDVPRCLDSIQFEVGEGPGLESAAKEAVESTDISNDPRWPTFGPRCLAETGARSILTLRLFADEDRLGALTLYGDEAGAFDDEAAAMAAILASHAAVAIRHERKREQLAEALTSRDVIGQAKGLLMARQAMSSDEAFELLRKASQRLNIKLRDVAAQILDQNRPGTSHG